MSDKQPRCNSQVMSSNILYRSRKEPDNMDTSLKRGQFKINTDKVLQKSIISDTVSRHFRSQFFYLLNTDIGHAWHNVSRSCRKDGPISNVTHLDVHSTPIVIASFAKLPELMQAEISRTVKSWPWHPGLRRWNKLFYSSGSYCNFTRQLLRRTCHCVTCLLKGPALYPAVF